MIIILITIQVSVGICGVSVPSGFENFFLFLFFCLIFLNNSVSKHIIGSK